MSTFLGAGIYGMSFFDIPAYSTCSRHIYTSFASKNMIICTFKLIFYAIFLFVFYSI